LLGEASGSGRRPRRRSRGSTRRWTCASTAAISSSLGAGSAWNTGAPAAGGAPVEPRVDRAGDLAVLSRDSVTLPVDEIGRIQSPLAMAGGRIVDAAAPFAEFEDERPAD